MISWDRREPFGDGWTLVLKNRTEYCIWWWWQSLIWIFNIELFILSFPPIWSQYVVHTFLFKMHFLRICRNTFLVKLFPGGKIGESFLWVSIFLGGVVETPPFLSSLLQLFFGYFLQLGKTQYPKNIFEFKGVNKNDCELGLGGSTISFRVLKQAYKRAVKIYYKGHARNYFWK